jgi:hypothetical protein
LHVAAHQDRPSIESDDPRYVVPWVDEGYLTWTIHWTIGKQGVKLQVKPGDKWLPPNPKDSGPQYPLNINDTREPNYLRVIHVVPGSYYLNAPWSDWMKK